MKDPFNSPARPSGTGTPTTSSQPLKGILKTPDRGQYSGGTSTHSGGQSKSTKKRNKKNKKHGTPNILRGGDTKRGHGYS